MNDAVDLGSSQPAAGATKPYPPSSADRFMDWVKRLPIPYGLTYLLLIVLQSAIAHGVAWATGGLPAYRLSPLALLFPLWLWGPLAIMTYLDSIALQGLHNFSPLLDIQPESMRRLKYEFATMPGRSVIISGVVWSLIYLIFTYVAFDTVYVAYRFGTAYTAFAMVEGLVSFAIGSVIYYHTLRQLSLVSRTVGMVKQFDLFQLEPVYAFSVVTAQTGVGWVSLISLTMLIVPIQMALGPVLITLVVQVGLALAAFALPLRIVNQRLVAEKRRLQAEHDQRVKSMLARLHRRVDGDEFDSMLQFNSAVAALNAEGEILAKIPTWPWRPGLLTGFLSVVVLPIILFLVQFALGEWLGQ